MPERLFTSNYLHFVGWFDLFCVRGFLGDVYCTSKNHTLLLHRLRHAFKSLYYFKTLAISLNIRV